MFLESRLYRERDAWLEKLSKGDPGGWFIPQDAGLGEPLQRVHDELVALGYIELDSNNHGFRISSQGRTYLSQIQEFKEDNDEVGQAIETFMLWVLEGRPGRGRLYPRRIAQDLTMEHMLFDQALVELDEVFPDALEIEPLNRLGHHEHVGSFRILNPLKTYAKHVRGGMCWEELSSIGSSFFRMVTPIHMEQNVSDNSTNFTLNNSTVDRAAFAVGEHNTATVNITDEPTKDDAQEFVELVGELLAKVETVANDSLEHHLGTQEVLTALYARVLELDERLLDALLEQKASVDDIVHMLEPIWEAHVGELTQDKWAARSKALGGKVLTKAVAKLVTKPL